MTNRRFKFHGGKRGAALAIRVTPRASKNEITEIMSDGTVKVRLTAPPVEGKANLALITLLAQVLGVSVSQIEIVAGDTGRDKLVSILDLDADQVHQRIIAALSG